MRENIDIFIPILQGHSILKIVIVQNYKMMKRGIISRVHFVRDVLMIQIVVVAKVINR